MSEATSGTVSQADAVSPDIASLIRATGPSPPHLEKLLEQRRRFGLAYGRINFRHVVARRLRKKTDPGIHRAALRIRGAVIEPADPGKRNRARAHGAGLQGDV